MKLKLLGALGSDSTFIKLKDQNWLDKQRIAGKVVAQTLTLLEELVRNKTTYTLLQLDKIAEDFILMNNCIPTFKNYKGFPNACCISVNRQLVHGIPTDYQLQEGDLISFDLGATYQGSIADSAITVIYGQPKSEKHLNLIKATEEALNKGIEAIKVGSRIGAIGQAIYKYAREYGYSVVDRFGGHGICTDEDGAGIPHAAPFVSNKSIAEDGIRIKPGLVIAIEPLLVLGSSNRTRTSDDGWSVMCDDLCAHFEASVYVHENYVEVVTKR